MARIQQSPGLQQPFSNIFPQPVLSTRSPTVNDRNFSIGQRWINTKTNQSYTLTSVSAGRAEWDLNSVDPDNVSLRFGQSPISQSQSALGTAPTGGATDVNLLIFQKGVIMEQFNITTQTMIVPRMNIVGLGISLTTDTGKGVEYNFGADRTNSCPSFKIGTSPAFFFEINIGIDVIDEANPYLMGFRKIQDNEQVFANYTDYATIGMSKALSTTNISTLVSLNGNASSAVTDAVWGGNSAFNVLRVLVSGSGAVTYTVNGKTPLPPISALTFDTGDIVGPFIHLLHGTNPGVIFLTSMKFGFQA